MILLRFFIFGRLHFRKKDQNFFLHNLSASGLDVLKCKMSFCSTYRARIFDIIKRGKGNFGLNASSNVYHMIADSERKVVLKDIKLLEYILTCYFTMSTLSIFTPFLFFPSKERRINLRWSKNSLKQPMAKKVWASVENWKVVIKNSKNMIWC